MKKFCIILALLVLMAALLTACGTPKPAADGSVRDGWTENSGPNNFKATFKLFTGHETKKIEVKEGQVLTFDFNSEIKDGLVDMKINDPTGLTILVLEQNKKAVKQISVSKTTVYTLIVTGDKAQGSIDLNWSIK